MQGKRRILAMLLVLCMVMGFMAVSAVAADFEDMPQEGDWSYAAMNAAVDNGLLKGTDGKLLPDGEVSRAQLAAILSRAFGASAQADLSAYTDVARDAWYYADMAKAVGMKTLAGSGNSLRPGDTVTRQETFVALARALKLAPGNASVLNTYSDGAQVAPWAAECVAAMVGGKYIEGSNGKLNPTGTITRAELAQVLYKLIPAYVSTAGSYTAAAAGNLMVNVPDVTLKGITVPGDLILGEGVGEGDVTLSGVTVAGRLVVRGGGGQSIHIADKSTVGAVVMGKTGSGAVRVVSESGASVKSVTVGDGGGKVILEGAFDTVAVNSAAPVTLQNATVANLDVSAENAVVSLEGKTTVTEAKVDAAAEGAALTVAKGATVSKLDSAAPKVSVSGDGKVTEAIVSGNDTKVNTAGTTVTVDRGVTGVTAGDKPVAGGETVTTEPSKPSGSGGGSSGPSASPKTVTTAAEFLAAMDNSNCSAILVEGELAVYMEGGDIKKPLTIQTGGTLTLFGALGLQSTTLTVETGGALAVAGYLNLSAATLVNSGAVTVTPGAELELFASTGISGTGTICTETDAGSEYNKGTVTFTDLITSPSPVLWGDVSKFVAQGANIQYAAVVNTEARLTEAMKSEEPAYAALYLQSGATVALTEDLTMDGFVLIIQNGATLTVPVGKALTIAADSALFIEGVLDTTAGTTTNNGFYKLAAIGTLIGTITDGEGGHHAANYTVKTQDDWDKAMEELENCSYINVDAGAETITIAATEGEEALALPELALTSGTLNISEDAKATAGGYWALKRGTTLTNAGELTLSNVEINGTVTNSGTLNLTGYTGVTGTITNSGTLSIGDDANLELYGATLSNTGEGTVANSGRFWMENSAFTSAADLSSLVNVEVSDLFKGATSPSTIPEGVTPAYYEARISDEAGLIAFQTATLPAVEEVNAHVTEDFNVTRAITLARELNVNGGFDESGEAIPNTLTVKSGGSLTVKENVCLGIGSAGVLNIERGGAVVVNGQLALDKYEDTEWKNADGGSISNAGTITVSDKNEGENFYPQLDIRPDATLTNNGVLTIGGDCGVLGTLDGSGTLTVRPKSETCHPSLYISKDGESTGTLTTGTLTNGSDVSVDGGTLTSGAIANSGYLGIKGGTLNLTGNAKITNSGEEAYVEAADDYASGTATAATVPDAPFVTHDATREDDGYERVANVPDAASLTAALADTQAGYTMIRVQGGIEWSGTVGADSKLVIENYWDDSEEGNVGSSLTLTGATTVLGRLEIRGGDVANTLTVNGSVTLTVGDDENEASAENWGKVANNGTITLNTGSHLDGEGEFTGTAVAGEGDAISDGWKVAATE